jgi:fatty-acyl-CoA synthase
VRRTKSELDCGFSILFGQTEMHGVISQTATTDSPEDQSRTIGRPLPQAEVRIVDPETDETVPIGASGEICVRGYQTMHSYFELPDATAAAITADGWLHSGDLGAMDERGYLTITGRLKDMIIRGGVNIYADVAAGGGVDVPAVLGLQARTAERQLEREASWFRLAGFTMDAPPIDVVLSGSASGVP